MADITSVKQFFAETMPQVANDPSKSGGLNATYQFNITGAEGGEWYMTLNDGSGSVTEGTSDAPDVTITCTDENWVKIVKGELNPQMAFMQQKIKIAGKMPLALKLTSFLK